MKHVGFGYYLREGIANLFSHGFRPFAAIGVTIACLVVMGTFSLVAYNAEVMLQNLTSDYQILAFVEDGATDDRENEIARALDKVDNVASVTYISREEATAAFEEQHKDEEIMQGLDASIFRNRFAVYVKDLTQVKTTAEAVGKIEGVAKVRVDEDIAGGFVTLRNVASVIGITLILVLFVISAFIISNTIRLTTHDRQTEIAILKMVGASDGFIRWPFVYEGLAIGFISAMIAFLLQWLLYVSVAESIAVSDRLQLFSIVDFSEIILPVALSFLGVGLAVGVGGSVTAVRKFLRV